MMNKVAQFYRELVATLTERLRNGERDIDALVEQARARVTQTGELTRTEVEEVTRAVRRDWRSSREAMKSEDGSPTAFLCGSLKRACGRSWQILPIKLSWNGVRCFRI